jgi:hypothetical protein
VLDSWAKTSNMTINREKSGVMVFDGPAPPTNELRGFPLVATYKYLGCQVSSSLELAAHTRTTLSKIVFLRGRLAPVLKRGRVRYNLSLFCALVLPLYRQAYALYDCSSATDQDAFRRAIRKQARAFLALPPTTPNRLVEGMLGDLGPSALAVCRACDSLLESRNARRPPDRQLLFALKEGPRTRTLPDSFASALRLTYGRRCAQHGVPLLVSHLIERHGITIGLDAALELFQ